MAFYTIGEHQINADLVAWTRRLGTGEVELHFAVPQAAWTPLHAKETGVQNPPSVTLTLEGRDADEAWRLFGQHK